MSINSFFGALLAVAALWGCGNRDHALASSTTEPKVAAMTTEVTIKLNELGPSFAKRYPDKVHVQHQPAGLNFYKIDSHRATWPLPINLVEI